MNLNMSQFKKVKEDGNMAVLKHPQGHNITIAKRSLSSKMQKELASLPLHQAEADDVVQDPNKPSGASGSWDQPQPSAQMPAQNPPPVINVNVGQQSPIAPMSPPTQVAQNVMKDPNVSEGAKEEAQKAASDIPNPQFPQAQPAMPSPTAAATPPSPSIPQAQPQAAPQQLGDMNPFEAVPQGFQMQAQGLGQEAQAQGEASKAQAGIFGQAAQAQQNLMNQFNSVTKPMMDERAALQQDMANQHFDSKQYVNNMSVGKKVLTAIGMLFGGVGQGMLGGENVALQQLNRHIDQDIEDQKRNFGKKQTLLEANYRNFGDLKTATDMTRVQLGDVFSNLIQQQAALSNDPLVKARATQAIGQLYQNGSQAIKNNLFEKMLFDKMNPQAAPQAQPGQAGAQAAPGQTGAPQSPEDNTKSYLDYLRFKNPEMAKNLEERYVPGVGTATVPVPTEARDKLVAGEHFQNMLNDLIDFAKNNQGTVLNREIVNQGKVKASLVQEAYRQAAQAGVFKQGEYAFINSLADADPTKFLAEVRTLPGYKELRQTNIDKLNVLKKTYGLPVPKQIKSAEDFIK